MENTPEISVILPVHNEEGNLHALHAALSEVLGALPHTYELVFVDDGSTDGSLELLRKLALSDPRMHYLSLSRNFGQQIALSAGLDQARGAYLAFMDADLQDPPHLLPSLLEKLQNGYDVAYAQRTDRQGEGILKKATAKYFYRLLNRFSRLSIPLDTGDFRMMTRQVAEVLRQMPERQKFLRGQIAWAGFRQVAVPFSRPGRLKGKSHFTWSGMGRMAIDAFTAYTDLPLRFVTLAGFVVSIIAFLLILYTYYVKMFTHDYVPGWASLMVAVTFLGGVQLIGIGILGEYISRIHTNSQQRPLYIIKETGCGPKERPMSDR